MNINRIDYKNYKNEQGLSLAIGFFDGVHKGHRLIIKETLKDKSLIPAVLTFSLNMKIGMEKKNSLLLTEEEKEEEIAKLGIREYFLLPFTEEVKHSSIEEFLDFLLRLNVREVIVGKDFTFANRGEGKAEALKILEERRIKVRIIDLFFEEGDKVSSTRIKRLLEEGKIEEANELLGYSYYVQGKVIHGLANGRK
ncbi:MAG: FAD synthetase family protein, partial [Bacilli bacterium]